MLMRRSQPTTEKLAPWASSLAYSWEAMIRMEIVTTRTQGLIILWLQNPVVILPIVF